MQNLLIIGKEQKVIHIADVTPALQFLFDKVWQMISVDMSVAEIMNTWPQTVQLFLRYRMLCIGCEFSEFDTLNEVIKNYGFNSEKFLQELNDLIHNDTVA